MRSLLWFILFLLSVSGASAHNWYFDTSLERLSRISLQPGDTVLLRGGVIFQGPLQLPAGCAGHARHPIVITSYGQGRAVIDGAAAPP